MQEWLEVRKLCSQELEIRLCGQKGRKQERGAGGGGGHSLSFFQHSQSTQGCLCSGASFKDRRRSFKRKRLQIRCGLEGETLFAVELEKVQKPAGTQGLGQHSRVNTFGQVWQLLGLCGANVTLAADTEAVGEAKVLQGSWRQKIGSVLPPHGSASFFFS